jgi:hypothetical protein
MFLYKTAPTSETEKECTGCGNIRPLTDFSKHVTGVGGLRAKCKACSNEDGREYYQKCSGVRDPDAEDSDPNPKRQKTPETPASVSDLYVMSLSIDPEGLVFGLKVGRSGNVTQRANNLCESMPFSMVLLATIPGAGHLEKEIHARLAPTRNTSGKGREWFRTGLPDVLHAVACAMQSRSKVNGSASSASGTE